MDQQRNAAQEAEAFARVWKRVSPDPDKSPIECQSVNASASPPSGKQEPEQAAPQWEAFLRREIVLELTRWRTYRALSTLSSHTVLVSMAAGALRRAKRMAAVLFLLTGVWYLPQNQAIPRNWKTPREGYRILFHGAQRAEMSYRSAAGKNPDPLLAELFQNLAREAANEQRRLLQLLSK
mgnify:CR=1 FL=1